MSNLAETDPAKPWTLLPLLLSSLYHAEVTRRPRRISYRAEVQQVAQFLVSSYSGHPLLLGIHLPPLLRSPSRAQGGRYREFFTTGLVPTPDAGELAKKGLWYLHPWGGVRGIPGESPLYQADWRNRQQLPQTNQLSLSFLRLPFLPHSTSPPPRARHSHAAAGLPPPPGIRSPPGKRKQINSRGPAKSGELARD